MNFYKMMIIIKWLEGFIEIEKDFDWVRIYECFNVINAVCAVHSLTGHQYIVNWIEEMESANFLTKRQDCVLFIRVGRCCVM